MASSSQRVYTSCSLFLSLSQDSIQFFFDLAARHRMRQPLPIVRGYYIERCFRVRFLTTKRWSWRTVQRVLHVCKDEASVFENCQKYRNAKTLYKHMYVVSVSNAPRVAFDCLCFTYTTVHVKLTLTYYKFTWMYCKSVYVNTCSTIS